MPAQASPRGLDRVRVEVHRLLVTPGAKRRALLYEELASLLQAGIGVRAAVAALSERVDARTEPLLAAWRLQVEQGEPLHEGMHGHIDLFAPLEVTMVRIGERSGRLVETLRKLAGRLETARKARLAIAAAVAYPVTVLHVALLLPTLPLVLLPFGFGAYVALVLIGLAVIWGLPAALAALYVARRDDPAFARRVCRLPIVGAAVYAGAVERFAWTLGALNDAGDAPDAALEEAAAAADCGWFRSGLADALARLREGNTLTVAVQGLAAVPREVVEMLSTGEISGAIAESMSRAAQLYEERRSRAVRSAAATAGAVMFGLAVLVVVMAVLSVFFRVYGPLFEMTR